MKKINAEKEIKNSYKKLFLTIIDNIDKFDIDVRIEPEINEMVNWLGNGIRTTRYTRIITLRDKEYIEEPITKEDLF